MDGLIGMSALAAFMTVVWFVPYFSLIRPRLHPLVDGGATGLLTACTPMLSSALAVRMGWSTTATRTLWEYSVVCATVVLVSTLLAGVLTYFGGARKRSVV